MWEAMTNNPYLDTDWLDNQFSAAMKEQERTAILAILSAKKAEISNENIELSQKLTQQSSEMKDFTSNRLVSHLKSGLEGKGADAANEYLSHTLKKPKLKSPIEGAE
ncbi:hypothetical protein [Lactococcus allomyrinae]|uniref:Uncharacterized protein n=1 Tax=Lactococcus allomyrinae TaxID=2419773 RepID=A0A387B9E2_9LACT|nr:hypothetical protein [Lactococcus allomyrinae]AYG00333.1 hypothetical protein D7I46_04045 [Lactococcus allomyrinae]